MQDLSVDLVSSPDVKVGAAPALAAVHVNAAAPAQAGVGLVGGQAGPNANTADRKKAVLIKGNRHTSQSSSAGAAASEGVEGKAEKIHMVTPFPKCSLPGALLPIRKRCMLS